MYVKEFASCVPNVYLGKLFLKLGTGVELLLISPTEKKKTNKQTKQNKTMNNNNITHTLFRE
jgi:hypothetical protein